MEYLGKEFKYVKEENVAEFFDTFDIPQETKEKWKKAQSPKKISKNADGTYSWAAPSGPIVFKPGVEFEQKFPEFTAKMTITIDGNTVTQQVKSNDRIIKSILEFAGNELVETTTASDWNGVAKRYYKA